MVIFIIKRLLIIAYVYPPTGGGGAQRTSKFVKYLPQFQWEPWVVAAKKSRLFPYDPSLLIDVPPNARIFRINAFESRIWGGLPDVLGINRKWFFQIPDENIFWYPFAYSKANSLGYLFPVAPEPQNMHKNGRQKSGSPDFVLLGYYKKIDVRRLFTIEEGQRINSGDHFYERQIR